MKVSIIGTGYVGLVTGACLAEHGHAVVCVDVDRRKVDMINAAQTPIRERGLAELLRRHAGKGLRASTDLPASVLDSDVIFIAVGTPSANGRIDLQHVMRAADEVGAVLRDSSRYHVVVVKSTVIPGTTDGTVRDRLESASAKRAGHDFGLGMNPEFLAEGNAVDGCAKPGRLVLGGLDARTHGVLQELYRGTDASVPRLLTDNPTAEMIKYASNAVLATMISFSNEIARLCSAVGVDAIDVMRGVHEAAHFTTQRGSDRVTAAISAFLEPGCGFGGSCLPKDVAALVGQGANLGVGMPLLRSVLEVNRGQTDEVMRLIAKHYASLREVPVTVLGIAFKPETDDTRESPAFPIIARLCEAGARVTAYDPVVRPMEDSRLAGVRLAASLTDAVRHAEVIVLATRWSEFGELRNALSGRRGEPLVVDGRRMLVPGQYERYEAIGR